MPKANQLKKTQRAKIEAIVLEARDAVIRIDDLGAPIRAVKVLREILRFMPDMLAENIGLLDLIKPIPVIPFEAACCDKVASLMRNQGKTGYYHSSILTIDLIKLPKVKTPQSPYFILQTETSDTPKPGPGKRHLTIAEAIAYATHTGFTNPIPALANEKKDGKTISVCLDSRNRPVVNFTDIPTRFVFCNNSLILQ